MCGKEEDGTRRGKRSGRDHEETSRAEQWPKIAGRNQRREGERRRGKAAVKIADLHKTLLGVILGHCSLARGGRRGVRREEIIKKCPHEVQIAVIFNEKNSREISAQSQFPKSLIFALYAIFCSHK